MPQLLALEIRTEHDVVLARQRARQVAELLGLEAHEQTRLATAVSEIARNAFRYAGGGRVSFAIEEGAGCGPAATPRATAAAQCLVVRVDDRGPGIRDLDAVLEGRFRSTTGMGLGILGARRLTDAFDVTSSPAGTTVTMWRLLPRGAGAPTLATVARVAEALARQSPATPFDEVLAQNQELLRTLDELRARQAEVERLNSELADTNRGVLALYAELDDKAEELRRASDLKSSFISNVSHELRTPLSSILNLARMLAEQELGDEPRRAVGFIRKSAQSLTEIVNDLLDLAKIEAGRVDVHVSEFSAADLFATLRGVFRPLATNEAVQLVFDEPAQRLPPLRTDEGKLAQVLRNFVSNALKYTERGEVRVSVAPGPEDTLVFAVRDTGIGVAPADIHRIFEEFTQIEGPLQRRVKGTGLGLPLSRKLAHLLGGTLAVESVPGEGSTFTLCVPRVLQPDPVGPRAEEAAARG